MKRCCLIAMAVLGGWLAQAQPNVTGTLPTPRGPTLITSTSADFDLSGREVTYRGRVRVDDSQMKLACERLVADVPQTGGHLDHLVAETNVVIDFADDKGQTNHVTCDKAVYVFSLQDGVTNETATLTGNPQPRLENAQGTQVGDVIIWSRVNGNTHVNISGNYHMIYRPNPVPVPAETNLPAPDQITNAAAAGPNPPAINKTNLPPGTIRNIDSNLQ
jgi:hypothetical protein